MRSIFLLLLFAPLFLFSQFTDDFSDGNFTENPEWIGDTDRFIVNANQELQLFDEEKSGPAYLVTESEAIEDAEWEFLVKFNFNPTSSNYANVYLVSNNTNLSEPLNGYYVMLGNTNKHVSLYRQDGTSKNRIIEGTHLRLNSDPVEVRIKVSRDVEGNWTLMSDTLGGTDYYTEGVVFDDTYYRTNYFGVQCVYTSTRWDKFFFDDFVVTGEPYLDTIPPSFINFEIIDAENLLLEFDEPLSEESALNTYNYFINNGIGSPESVSFYSSDNSSVLLELAVPLQTPNNYVLQYQNISDLDGNVAPDGSFDFSFIEVEPGMVIINEFMKREGESANLPFPLYIELHNTTDFLIDISGWKFRSRYLRNIPPHVMRPGEHLILCEPDGYDFFVDFMQNPDNSIENGEMLLIENRLWMYVSEGSITLYDQDENIMEYVPYSDAYYAGTGKEAGGWSLERIDPNNLCGTFDNWKASEDSKGGTPGFVNSVDAPNIDTIPPEVLFVQVSDLTTLNIFFSERVLPDSASNINNYQLTPEVGNPISATIDPADDKVVIIQFENELSESFEYTLQIQNISDYCGNILEYQEISVSIYFPKKYDIVVTEIMRKAEPSLGFLPEANYVEIYNTTDKEINVTNWSYKIGNYANRYFSFHVLLPGEYLILCADEYADMFEEFGKVMSFESFPLMANAGQTITIFDENGTVIDLVTYSEMWYEEVWKRDGGWSLERIDPNNLCGTFDNWTASVDPRGGTPGIINSVDAPNINDTPPEVLFVSVSAANELTVHFSERINEDDALNLNNYEVTPDFGNPIYALFVSGSDKNVILQFPFGFTPNITYTLKVENISDICDNTLISQEIDFMVFNPEPFDVIITEIMPKPAPVVQLPDAEWVEIYNRTEYDINLEAWIFSAGSTSRTLPFAVIPAGDYAVLCHVNNVNLFSGINNVIGVASFPALTNSGTSLSLQFKNGDYIHTVTYSDTWFKEPFKKAGGWSLEMIDVNNPCEERENWAETKDSRGGTPGAENSVAAENPDIKSPYPIAAEIIAPDTVIVWFNEILPQEYAENVLSYSIEEFGNPVWVKAKAPRYSEVKMKFDANFPQGQLFYLNLHDSIMDCSGNLVLNNTSIRIAIPDSVAAGDLVINELLFNPPTGGSNFVELYNNSDKILDLKKLWISNRNSAGEIANSRQISDKSRLILPGEYCAITTSIKGITDHYFIMSEDHLFEAASMPTMANASGFSIITDRFFNIIDEVAYNERQHYPLLASRKGVSLERINYDRPSSDKSNWHSAAQSVGYATPGYKNSQYADNILEQSKISLSPEVFSPDNDGYNDFLTISYQFDEPGYTITLAIFNSNGGLVRYLARNEMLGSEGYFIWDGFDDKDMLCPIGIYIVYAEMFSLSGNKRAEKHAVVLSRMKY